MRTVLGLVALTVFVLFYFGVYRPTRSSFSGWWTLSLLFVGASSSLLTFNGSDLQVVMLPASNVLAALCVTCIWFATRSLRRARLPRWLLAVAPIAILVPTVLDDPANNVWPGYGALFLYMAVMFVAASAETWRAWAARRARQGPAANNEAIVGLLVIALAGTVLGAFYVLRTVMHLAVGPESEAFATTAGSGPENAILLVSLVAVTFSVSAVGWDQQTQELRRRVREDDLTGLLGRTEFHVQSERACARARSRGARAHAVVADLDHFKEINDAHGHAAGDVALVAFAAVLRDELGRGEFAGRMGGEEFAAVLLDVDSAQAVARLDAIGRAFAARSSGVDFALPTVSFGLADLTDGATAAEIFERADLALYRAKAEGRDRVVEYSPELGLRPRKAGGRRASDLRPGPDSDQGAE